MKPSYRRRLINEMRQIQKLKNKRISKLEAFKKEILTLRQCNLSYQKVSDWLNKTHGIEVSTSQLHYMITIAWKDDPFLEKIREAPNS